MIKKILKIILWTLASIVLFLILVLGYFNLPVKNKIKRADIGVTFSHRYAQDIGLDWKANYIALLDDLKIKRVRIPIYWDWVEKEKDVYDFSEIDWQLDEAQKRGAEVVLVMGQKVPRWPECFIPKWIGENMDEVAQNDEIRRKELLEFIAIVTKRYKEHSAVRYWQIENEPFLKFGICPTIDGDLLDQEIATVKMINSERKIMITDSGELSLWIAAAKRADVFGTTMYRNVYKEGWGYYVYPLGPRFFLFKTWLIETFANQENAVVIELQGEPWVSGWTVHRPLEEQFNSMNEEKLKENIEYAKASGFDEVYVWGVEWWYWLKETQNYPLLWEAARDEIKKSALGE
ncbi:MAG: beta-galactosidase [Candidatus Moranbacteria bacterium]|nr:beta-galactosidase [Candidatus Moranbacteria bacterium]